MKLFSAYVSFSLAISAADAKVLRVFPGESIQDAVDAASPGDKIFVKEGTYKEDSTSTYGLRVATNDIRLIGEGGMVRLLHDGDQETGVFAAPHGCDYYRDKECAHPDLENFEIEGFSVEGFPENGIQTRWVDGFKVARCASINNLENGIYATLSKNGIVKSSFSSGSLDSALWVAGSQNTTVKNCELTQAPTGLEITVSNDVWAKNNYIHDNTVGVGLYHPNMAGNPPVGDQDNWVIENNRIYNNNLNNTAPPGSFQAALIPGVGVLVVGVSNHAIRKNDIRGNEITGIGVFGFCTITSVTPLPDCTAYPPKNGDPSADNNTISDNFLKGNAYATPPPFLPPGTYDFIYIQNPQLDETGDGNCFENNRDPDEFTLFSYEDELPTGGCT